MSNKHILKPYEAKNLYLLLCEKSNKDPLKNEFDCTHLEAKNKIPHGSKVYFQRNVLVSGEPSTNYAFLDRWTSCITGNRQKILYIPNKKMDEILAYLNISDSVELFNEISKRTVASFNNQHKRSLPSNSPFSNTNWHGYYRARDPHTSKICICKSVMHINTFGGITLLNVEGEDYNNYSGQAFISPQNKQLSIIMNPVHVDTNEEIGDETYIICSVPTSPYNLNNEYYLEGIYLQSSQRKEVRSGTVFFELTTEPARTLKPEILPITISTKSSPRLPPRMPFQLRYSNLPSCIKRVLFDRHHNFLSTTREDIRNISDLRKLIKKWDLKYSTKSRPLYDVFISTPISNYSDKQIKINRDEVDRIIQGIKKSFAPIIGDDKLIIRSPFDKDKHPPEVGQERKSFLHRASIAEIENSGLFVLYYPTIAKSTSCFMEAAWAIRAGVACMFIGDKELFPKYIQELPQDYPVHFMPKFARDSHMFDNLTGCHYLTKREINK